MEWGSGDQAGWMSTMQSSGAAFSTTWFIILAQKTLRKGC